MYSPDLVNIGSGTGVSQNVQSGAMMGGIKKQGGVEGRIFQHSETTPVTLILYH